MGILRTTKLGKRYTSLLSWLIWATLEMSTMLVALFFDKTGALLRWIGGLIVRHVYYVFVRLARWVDGKPGWRESDSWIGVPPPAVTGAAESAPPFNIESFFEESRARGLKVLESVAMVSAVQGLSPQERCDLVNAISAMDGPLVSAVPKREIV